MLTLADLKDKKEMSARDESVNNETSYRINDGTVDESDMNLTRVLRFDSANFTKGLSTTQVNTIERADPSKHTNLTPSFQIFHGAGDIAHVRSRNDELRFWLGSKKVCK